MFVLYPHQTCYVVPAAAAHLVPDGVPPARAVLAANLETAVNGVWDAGISVGDRVTIVGAGAVGSMAAWLAARIAACDVELVDVNPSRAAVARALGVRFAAPEDASGDRDVVIHASGSQAGLQRALEIAATIRSSQVGSVAPAQRARWDARRRMRLALSLLADSTLDVLITGESGFDDLPQVMPRLAAGGDAIVHRVRYA